LASLKVAQSIGRKKSMIKLRKKEKINREKNKENSNKKIKLKKKKKSRRSFPIHMNREAP